MLYAKPKTAGEAAKLLAAETGVTRVLAGGTDVLVQLKAGMIEPALIVDIKAIPGIRDITVENGGFRIGAAVSGIELGEHAALCAMYPGVTEGAQLIGSKQVQGRCSMVGNLCNGSPAGDAVPGLVAAGATVRIEGPSGSRDVPVEQIPAGPGKITLTKGEIITSVFLPARPARSSDAYLRFIPRTEMDIAVASAGVSLTLDAAGTITAARVALGAVAATVLLVEAAAKAIIGTKLDEAALAALEKAASAACQTHRRQTRHRRVPHQCGWRPRPPRRCYCVPTRRRSEMKSIHVATTVNGDAVEFVCAPDEPLLDVLRNRLGLTGAKEGCGTGDCGACTVTLNGRMVCSCLVLGAEAEGADDHHDRRHGNRGTSCTRCNRPSSTTPPCNAASARRAFWSPPRTCWTTTPTRPTPSCVTGLPATFAAAPAMTRSSPPFRTPPQR